MKKIISILVMMGLLIIAPTAINAQNLSKSEKKEAKQAAKDLVKEGWKVQGMGTMEGNMLRIMERSASGEVPLYGVALGGYTQPNVALSNCIAEAINEYVKTTGNSIIQERVATEVANMGGSESANLVDMAEQNFIKELKGELRSPVLKITRGDAKQGTFEMQCWWLLNENKLAKIRENAVKNAMSDVEDASELGNKISDFVKGNN